MSNTKLYDLSARLEGIKAGADTSENERLGNFLTSAIANAPRAEGGNLMKFFNWARELSKADPDRMHLILDSEDVKVLYKFIEDNQMLSIWVKGSLIDVLENQGSPVPKSGEK